MQNESKQGYVYILTNSSFKEDWVKIGKSSRPVDVRSKELDNTAVPLPFEIFATMKTCKYNEVEKLVHKTIDRLTDLRIRQNREFFNEYEDRIYKLSPFVGTFMPEEKRNTSGAYQGPKFFSYNGQTLDDLRTEMGSLSMD